MKHTENGAFISTSDSTAERIPSVPVISLPMGGNTILRVAGGFAAHQILETGSTAVRVVVSGFASTSNPSLLYPIKRVPAPIRSAWLEIQRCIRVPGESRIVWGSLCKN